MDFIPLIKAFGPAIAGPIQYQSKSTADPNPPGFSQSFSRVGGGMLEDLAGGHDQIAFYDSLCGSFGWNNLKLKFRLHFFVCNSR
jgi:hypothetical protein